MACRRTNPSWSNVTRCSGRWLACRDRFVTATMKALPDLELSEVFWRSHFAIGVMVNTASASGLLAAVSGGRCSIDSAEEVSYRVVAFIVGGFRADPSRTAAAIRRATPEEVLA